MEDTEKNSYNYLNQITTYWGEAYWLELEHLKTGLLPMDSFDCNLHLRSYKYLYWKGNLFGLHLLDKKKKSSVYIQLEVGDSDSTRNSPTATSASKYTILLSDYCLAWSLFSWRRNWFTKKNLKQKQLLKRIVIIQIHNSRVCRLFVKRKNTIKTGFPSILRRNVKGNDKVW